MPHEIQIHFSGSIDKGLGKALKEISKESVKIFKAREETRKVAQDMKVSSNENGIHYGAFYVTKPVNHVNELIIRAEKMAQRARRANDWTLPAFKAFCTKMDLAAPEKNYWQLASELKFTLDEIRYIESNNNDKKTEAVLLHSGREYLTYDIVIACGKIGNYAAIDALEENL